MRFTDLLSKYIFSVISYFYILLFSYAAVSKLLDFENFRIQLGQSPLVSAHAGVLSFAVPIAELLIAGGLIFKHTRFISFLMGYLLMVMFSSYIYFILHYSSFVPCSCGGILEKMGWQEHLAFNIIVTLLGGIAIVTERYRRVSGLKNVKWGILLLVLIVLTAFGILSVGILFRSSESLIHKRNPFVRQFIPFSAHEQNRATLDFNSYYLAGADSLTVYLGNYTAPRYVTALDTSLIISTSFLIDIPKEISFHRSAKLSVVPPQFFLIDGHEPIVLRGRTAKWKIVEKYSPDVFFSKSAVLDSVHLMIRTRNEANGESVLAKLSLEDNAVTYYPHILERQLDGVFDTDGDLLYQSDSGTLFYLYRYRNQFITTTSEVTTNRHHTIDTNTRAKLTFATLEEKGQKKFAVPPLIVNKSVALYKNLVFVLSMQRGRFQSLKMWRATSTIDVYDRDTGVYYSSFYLYHIDHTSIRDFMVREDRLYAIAGSALVSYKLEEAITKHYH
ncbi:hypothetical protein GN157_12920 [Flavobacterium rakeshii]|uniref:Methylamine utilisation protein MauE domain-containing protein n=1 Tax=Flavobacterium rakeshii TaxID=1038845 RepID=A0A6N8HFW3_9FLAO|nr:MauE/DoxX family redox-associated membrane protein [Flavobacterium rakeshii]MUV04612.1 hypothetical protein [Flavobacterium rakeshii]